MLNDYIVIPRERLDESSVATQRRSQPEGRYAGPVLKQPAKSTVGACPSDQSFAGDGSRLRENPKLHGNFSTFAAIPRVSWLTKSGYPPEEAAEVWSTTADLAKKTIGRCGPLGGAQRPKVDNLRF